MNSWVEDYLNHLDIIAGGKARFYKASPPDEFPPMTVITYPKDAVRETQISFTAGLSAVSHPAWELARPELCISVASNDKRWGASIGDIAFNLRGQCPFCYGDIVRFGTQMSAESEMSAFVVFAPGFITKNQFEIRLIDWTVSLAQMYPIYEGEIELIERHGLKSFFQRPGNFFENTQREDLSKQI